MITKVKLLDQLKIVLFIYPLVLLYWNYIGDGNDLIEILPTLKQWNQPELYPKDFFLNYIKSIEFFVQTSLKKGIAFLRQKSSLFVIGYSHSESDST